jgi:23S rRNA (cytosine1962-C5)-methyltransferase
MTTPQHLRLKKNEDRRLRAGHLWIYSNEIETPLKYFSSGQQVIIEAYDKTLLGTAYVNPHSLITARLLSRHSHVLFDTDFLINRIKIALKYRSRLFEEPYYRLIFGESDGLPGLVVDRFDTHLAVQINTAGMDARTDMIISALCKALPNTESILLRNDSSMRKLEGLPVSITAGYGTPPENIFLKENGVTFSAPLWTGQKTGWFYDHRDNRARLQQIVKQQRVLDVFSYLGAWGIQAAKFGAKEVVCIDSSALSQTWIQENARLNQVEQIIRTMTEDAFIALKNLAHENEKFDVIILDPPAFVKKQKDKKEGLLAYQRINEAAMKCLVDNGILISCSCSMHIEYSDLVQILRRAALHTKRDCRIIEQGHQGRDHPIHLAIPETDYLKMIMLHCLQ